MNYVALQACQKIFKGEAIEQKDYVKYLGVLIDSKLSFKQHIIGITKKISRAIGLLYKQFLKGF